MKVNKHFKHLFMNQKGIYMNIKTYDVDLANDETKLTTEYSKGIKKEMSSEDRYLKAIVYTLLDWSFGNPMWFSRQCTINTKTKCCAGDEYDIDTGHKLCEIKSDLKYHRKMYERYLKIAWLLRKYSNRVMAYVEKHQAKIERLEKEYEKYVK